MLRTIAVVGCGRYQEGREGWAIGHAHGVGWKKVAPDVRLVAVDPNSDNLTAFAGRFGLAPSDCFASTDAMYAEVTPDLVSVCTWPGLHAPQVLEAIRRGVKGVLCEKPLATSPLLVREMTEAASSSGVKLAVAHQRLFGSSWSAAKWLIQGGRLGGRLVLEFRVGGLWDLLSWTVHWFDMANFLLGEVPSAVMAGMDHTGGRLYGHAVEDQSVVFAEYPSGAQALFVTGPSSAFTEGVVIRGENGFVVVRDGEAELFSRDGYEKLDLAPYAHPAGDGFVAACRQLIDAVETGAPMLLDIERTQHATLMAFAAQEAFRTGRAVPYPPAFTYAPLEVVQHAPQRELGVSEVVLFADEHFGSGGRHGIAEAVTSLTGKAPRVVDATEGLSEADLEGAELLLLYHTQADATDSTLDVLTGWVESGKPTVFLHCAVGGYPEWEAYKDWAGAVWVWSGPEGSEHPIVESTLRRCEGVEWEWESAWLPVDEVFIKLKPTGDSEPLLQVEIEGGVYPAGWQSRAFRNVVTLIPGHREDLWQLPAMRSALAQVIRRAVRAQS